MIQRILPSVMASSQQEMDKLFRKLTSVAKHLHLDIGDGIFVPTKVNWFPVRLSKKFTYSVHLMVSDPLSWLKKHSSSQIKIILFHPEAKGSVIKVISEVRKQGKQVGLAIKPETKVSYIQQYLSQLDYVLILTVHPGYYGTLYLSQPLRKIKQLKKINPQLKVIVDGGINPKTIQQARAAGADFFVSGSFVTKAKDSKKALQELKKAIR